jgi:hypothetical protein
MVSTVKKSTASMLCGLAPQKRSPRDGGTLAGGGLAQDLPDGRPDSFNPSPLISPTIRW